MNHKFKITSNLIASLFILLTSSALFAGYGSIAFSMALGRSGFNGERYRYYDIPPGLFCNYYNLVTLLALSFILWVPWLWIKEGRKSFWGALLIFLLYLAAVIICQRYLDTKFIEKG